MSENGFAIRRNPCLRCEDKELCGICELNILRQKEQPPKRVEYKKKEKIQMKKFLALLLALTVAMFAGCTNTPAETTAPAPVETQAPTEAVSGLADAVAYVKTIYKNAADITAKDYEVISVVPMGTEKFEITWTVDVAEDVVAVVPGENGMTLIDVNENCSAETPYVLTATLTDGKETQTLSWNHTLPAAMNVDGLTYAEIVALAYALEDQQSTEDAYRLFGTVNSIDTEWSEDYQNITVTIQVAGCEEQPIMCYRLKGEGAKDLKVGDAITVEGILKNYNGFVKGDGLDAFLILKPVMLLILIANFHTLVMTPLDSLVSIFIRGVTETCSVTNEEYLMLPLRGIVLEFPGLGGGSCLGGSPDMGSYATDYAKDFGKHGILLAYLFPGPWSWGNKGAVRMGDAVLDAICDKYGVNNLRLGVCGGSMGGHGDAWSKIGGFK